MSPDVILFVIYLSLIGVAIGTFTGLVPGIHVNTLAALMLVIYPSISGLISPFVPAEWVPVTIASCIVSASVVHSFVDFVPSVFTGMPEESDLLGMLPGHRLLAEGRGMDAVRAAAVGSLVGSIASVALALPLIWAMESGLSDYLEGITLGVILMCVILMIARESDAVRCCWACILILVSGLLGFICMEILTPGGIIPDSTLLFPMLTGLFGMPLLVQSISNGEIPEQTDSGTSPVGIIPGLKGVLTGGLAGWFPGITATTGAIVSENVSPEKGPEGFISLVASIGTACVVFTLITLAVTGSSRSGTMSAVSEIVGDIGTGLFILLLISVVVASVCGYYITILSGGLFSSVVDRIDMQMLNRVIIVVILILVALMTGVIGLVILFISTAIGFIPSDAEVGRVHLTGCLIVPVIISELGFTELLVAIL